MLFNSAFERCVVMCWSLAGCLSSQLELFCLVRYGWENDSGNVVLSVHSMQVGHISQMLGMPSCMADMKRGEYNTLGDFFMLRGKLISYHIAYRRSCIYFVGILVQF